MHPNSNAREHETELSKTTRSKESSHKSYQQNHIPKNDNIDLLIGFINVLLIHAANEHIK